MLNIKWSKYIPNKPTPKQLAFLSLPHEEALYGGSAGGGKSDALLMGALAYCDVPSFSGIIFRRTFSDMKLPSSILSRAKMWLAPFLATKEVKFVKGGGTLAFGYLKNEGVQLRYQSSEYQYIAFDELTQFYESEYEYLFSRLRRTTSNVEIPIKMRAASNPGGIGHTWVKRRFGITKDENGRWVGSNRDAPFIPAKLDDNPFVDPHYHTMLDKLGKVERERLKNGDWDVSEDSLFNKEWFTNRYTVKEFTSENYYQLLSMEGLKTVPESEMLIFSTVDCAASVKTGVNGTTYIKNKQPSHSVIATWGLTRDYQLLWLDNYRFQTTIPELVARICKNQKQWNPLYTIIEKNGPGEGVYQMCDKKGLPVKSIHSAREKIINSTAAQLRAEKGQIWLPSFRPWLRDLEDELFTWSGLQEQPDDQIDVLSNAANEAMELSTGFERSMQYRMGVKRAIPLYAGGLSPPRSDVGGNERFHKVYRPRMPFRRGGGSNLPLYG